MSINDDATEQVAEQLRLLTTAIRHVRQAQAAASRVDVLMDATPGIAREQASEARDQSSQALSVLAALEDVLKKNLQYGP